MYIIIAIDSTGIKVTNRGQWMNKKWNTNIRTKKGYLKIHIAIDIRSKKILSMQVTDEHVHDGKVLPTLVDDLVKSNGIIIDQLSLMVLMTVIIISGVYQKMVLHHVSNSEGMQG